MKLWYALFTKISTPLTDLILEISYQEVEADVWIYVCLIFFIIQLKLSCKQF